MTCLLITAGAIVVLLALLNLKTSRPDGKLISKFDMHAYRTMLGYIMPSRNESVVYFDSYVRAEALLDYIARAREKHEVGVIHCIMAAVTSASERNPKMNTFISGRRLYQRNHWYVSFSMKRKKMDKEAKLSAVKMTAKDEESFEDLCQRMNEKIGVERSDAKTYVDKELGLFFKFPRFLMRWCMGIVRWADYSNILPWGFIKSDGFYTSMFIANLGSLGMTAAYHHLYEYGTCPLFLMVGKIEPRPMVVDGEVVPVNTLHLRYSYDERIDDGLTSKYGMDSVKYALEHPEEVFGKVEEFVQKASGTASDAEGSE